MGLAGRVAALGERDFRLLFASSLVSRLGDGISNVALAFAVLEVSSSATALGAVLAARQLAEAGLVLAGGVWADRLPRQHVLLGAALAQGAVQAGTAALLLSDAASIPAIVALQLVYGAADGFVGPATMGLVPQTISPGRLQQGNALLGLAANGMSVVGPALGGILVAAGSPANALLADAATFATAAVLLARLRPARQAERGARRTFLRELREGWAEFRSRTWLWASVLLFGIGNLAFATYFVLGPIVAERELGGAAAWATLLTAFGAGSIVGGFVAFRMRPRRPLLASVVASLPFPVFLAALAVPLPVPVLAGVGAVVGAGLATHTALWFTVLQEQVPAAAIARVSSYDALGSFALIPLGSAVAGPVAAAVGVQTTLLVAAAIVLACEAAIAAIPSVWAIRARGVAPGAPEHVLPP